MRIEIYEDPEKQERVVRFRLVTDGHAATVLVVDERGERLPGGHALTIGYAGVTRTGMMSDFGLALDVRGRILDVTDA